MPHRQPLQHSSCHCTMGSTAGGEDLKTCSIHFQSRWWDEKDDDDDDDDDGDDDDDDEGDGDGGFH